MSQVSRSFNPFQVEATWEVDSTGGEGSPPVCTEIRLLAFDAARSQSFYQGFLGDPAEDHRWEDDDGRGG